MNITEKNKQFIDKINHNKALKDIRDALVNGQHPNLLVVCCSDSRVIPEEILSCSLGEIFVIRTAGWVMADKRLLTVMFYDPNQQVNTVDALDDSFDKFMKCSEIVTLKSQLRIAEGEDYGDDYIEFINDLMLNKQVLFKKSKYKLKVFDDYGKMEKAIFDKNVEMNGLCRILSGLAFEYGSTIRSKNLKETKTTIEINSNGSKYLRSWNIGFSSSKFVTDDTHVGEIGCVYNIITA